MWVRFMFLDEACEFFFFMIHLFFNLIVNFIIDFHCTVAVYVAAINTLVVEPEDSREAMHHLAQTLRLLNERLSAKGIVSDTTIAVVVIMAGYAYLLGQYDQGLVHLKGLQQMVELRGGVSQLTRNKPGFASKILR